MKVLYWITWFDAHSYMVGSVDVEANSVAELHKLYKISDYKNAEHMTICVAD